MSNWDKGRLLRSSILAGLLAVGLAAAPAMAQEAEEDEDEQQEEQQESQVQAQDRITVTGSLIRRDEFSSAAPIQVITAETATLEGLLLRPCRRRPGGGHQRRWPGRGQLSARDVCR